MDSDPITTTTKYQQVTVDVPEDRLAEFHAFFGRFLAGRTRRGRHGRPHGGGHGHRAAHGDRAAHGRRCAGRRGEAERGEAAGQPGETTEV